MSDQLKNVEQKLTEAVNIVNKNSWIPVFEILNQVDKEELFKPEFKSFSAWMKKITERLNVKERYLWRLLKAGRILKPHHIALLAQSERPCNPLSIIEAEKVSKLDEKLDIDVILLEHVLQKRESPAKIRQHYEKVTGKSIEKKESEVEMLRRLLKEKDNEIEKLKAEIEQLRNG